MYLCLENTIKDCDTMQNDKFVTISTLVWVAPVIKPVNDICIDVILRRYISSTV